VHGSGDDNVHYQGTELLLNRLIELGKQFDFMEYPGRTHALSEGEGTSYHLRALLARYLEEHLPGGSALGAPAMRGQVLALSIQRKDVLRKSLQALRPNPAQEKECFPHMLARPTQAGLSPEGLRSQALVGPRRPRREDDSLPESMRARRLDRSCALKLFTHPALEGRGVGRAAEEVLDEVVGRHGPARL
jgi:hypothetical protein